MSAAAAGMPFVPATRMPFVSATRMPFVSATRMPFVSAGMTFMSATMSPTTMIGLIAAAAVIAASAAIYGSDARPSRVRIPSRPRDLRPGRCR